MSLCRHYGGTTAGFYAWRGHGESLHAKQDRVLSKEIARCSYSITNGMAVRASIAC